MKQTKDLVAETFGDSGLLSKTIPNYKERPQQVEFSKKIQECIKKETPLIAEASTGVGKSFGALIPAFERIQETDEPVVVCTSSIILQSQYYEKDIPMLEKLYNYQVNPVLIKGRNNYLCPKKLNDAKNGKVGFTTSDFVKEFQEVLNWAIQSKEGDKGELDFVPSHTVWSSFACVTDNECTSKQCPFYSICPYYKQRSKIQTSKLIVTNYHYLFSALTSGADGMLPPKVKTLVLDEGHEINAIARDFQERKYSMNSLRNQFDHFAKAMQKAEHSEVSDTVFGLMTDMELDQVNATLTDMFVGIGHEFKRVVNQKHYYSDFWKIDIPERTRLQKYVTNHRDTMKFAITAAENYLRRFGFSFEELPAMIEIYGEDSVEWFVNVAKLIDFLDQKISLLDYYFAYDLNQDDGDDIFWLQKFQEGASIHVKPTTGRGLTQPLFEDGDYVPIVMSATLAANKSFDHVKSDLGITEQMGVEELIVSSPFNLEENLLWYLPDNTPAGNEKGHIDFALSEMRKVIEALQGKTLCLFTSRKNLLLAEEYFMKILPKSITVLSQERMPKQKIIDFMKSNDKTVILGTKSFFTGIDIQGPNLSAVLIDKFPFPMIGDPVNDTLMSQPRGFHKYSLPEAIISMKQGYGRLNRTATDKGIVAMYDGRLSTANYKNKIFNSFDFKIQATKSWDKVLEYIASL